MARIDLSKLILEVKAVSDSEETVEKVFVNSVQEIRAWGDNMAYPTDYAVMNGCQLTAENTGDENRPGTIFVLRNYRVLGNISNAFCVDSNNNIIDISLNQVALTAVRPCIALDIESYLFAMRQNPKEFCLSSKLRNGHQYYYMKYGEFPKSYVGNTLNEILEKMYNQKTIKKTGKIWNGCYNDSKNEYIKNTEYLYKGKKYVRCLSCGLNKNSVLKDGTIVSNQPIYKWVAVEPVSWKILNSESLPKELVPNGTGEGNLIYLQSEECLMGGISAGPSDVTTNNRIRRYLNTQFFNTAFPVIDFRSVEEIENHSDIKKTKIQRMNPDQSNENRRMSDTKMISEWIEGGQSVLLRGPSGIGKTERIQNLYPNLIYLKLTNSMFPEKVVGSMNLQTGEAVPPDFAKKAILSCATEKEKKLVEENMQNLYKIADDVYNRSKKSKEKVVILLDELLNVKQSVQSLVYTLVLNKFIESGSGLKLPANTVVVATGNQKKYSSVAENLAEPLEKRFDHILDMQPNVIEWITQCAVPYKIHPYVLCYIMSKFEEYGQSSDVDKIKYFWEGPEIAEENIDEYGCRGKTNDPRGWVSVSTMLYAFENSLRKGKYIGKDVEDILNKTLLSKLRQEWATDFFDFYNTLSLTPIEIATQSFGKNIPNTIRNKFICMASLFSANTKQVKVCHEFLMQIGLENYIAVFDKYLECWANNSQEYELKNDKKINSSVDLSNNDDTITK